MKTLLVITNFSLFLFLLEDNRTPVVLDAGNNNREVFDRLVDNPLNLGKVPPINDQTL